MKLRSLAAILCTVAACSAQAQRPAAEPLPGDAVFAAARNAAVQNIDRERLEDLAGRIDADHPLRAYVDYWRLRLRLAAGGGPISDAGAPIGSLDSEVRQFLSRNAGTLVADLMRRDWLLNLGKRREWAMFDAEYPNYVLRDEPAVACHAQASRMARGEDITQAARELLFQPRELGEACGQLFDALLQAGRFGPAELRQRLKLAIEANAVTGLRRLSAWLPGPPDAKLLAQAIDRPQQALANPALRTSREAALIAVSRLARDDPRAAADWLAADRTTLRDDERAFAFSQVAAAGQRRLMPQALEWVRQSGGAGASDDTLAWHVRATLQAQDWKLLRAVVDQMSDAGRRDPAWTYWLGRAHAAEGRRAEAEPLWQSIAGQPNFYGKLAAEEMGQLYSAPARAAAPTADELAEAARHPAFTRARHFYRMGLRFEGNREWNFALRGMSDRQLLAAAEWARREEMLDRTVNTADRTREEHDYTLRFPAPFRDRLTPFARERGLDPAWVYGLIRQESRFIMDARSGVGASGLMQVMPATGRWIASRMGVKGFHPAQLNEMDTNLSFGTYYLRTVLDSLDDSPLLATAAYNAGPGRPRNWRTFLSQPVDGAVFAEIVPFTETRDYVKKVLSNATIYGAIFTGKPQSLKARLGTVQPRGATAGGTDIP